MTENTETTLIPEKTETSNPEESISKEPLNIPVVSNLNNIPVRQYLDKTVVPLLLSGLAELVKARPKNPVEWLAHYLLANKDNIREN